MYKSYAFPMKIIWFAVVLHVVFLASVFDIYFTTSIVHGIPAQKNKFPPPAKRLVLFVADGMRADTFYRLTANETIAPVLRNIIEKTGTWGVSHTRVPTESRPGHVALIAGLYEDPSAITKGWKENPVEFDSLFNRSTLTLAWGSPDILPMFSKACMGRMWTETYRPEDEDFSGGHKSTSWLDEWVFERFEAFMARLRFRSVGDLWDLIHGDGVVFFLHLLASDTAGHTFKPHSWEYQNNVKLIDSGVKKVMDLLEDFFGYDGKTVYILTADHGMTDWGSHGAGDDSETQTPLVAWGAGIPPPIPSGGGAETCAKQPPRDFPRVDDSSWNLRGVCRHDAWQADIAPTMATLIGVPIPVNSVGYLLRPYLDLGPKEMAQAAFTNARQMLSQHAHRRASMEGSRWCGSRKSGGWGREVVCAVADWVMPWALYQPFVPLPPHAEATWLASISELIDAQDYDSAIAKSDELFGLAFSGVEYHHRYHKTLLLSAISLAFVAWILLLSVLITSGPGREHLVDTTASQCGLELSLPIDVPAVLLSAFMAFYLFAFASPLQYYVYCLLPIALWWALLRLIRRQGTFFGSGWKSYHCIHRHSMISSSFFVAAYLAAMEILVLSFFHRWVLSLGMAALALQPLVRLPKRRCGVGDAAKVLYWALSCVALGVFPFMPVVGKEGDTNLVVSACILFMGVASLALLCVSLGRGAFRTQLVWQWPLWIQVGVALPLAAWNIVQADESFMDNRGLPAACQVLSWFLSVSSLAWPLVARRTQPEAVPLQQVSLQLVSVFVSLAVPYLLLSVRHEGFFLLALAVNAHAWVTVEQVSVGSQVAQGPTQATWDNLRISYTFMFLIVTSFFGTGNMASVNSFDPAWVRRFLSVFSPHVMGALILGKTCIPFLLVACAFRAVNVLHKTQQQTGQQFLMVLALSDLSGLHFLHWVRDTGSWLDIGTSLSHFVIQEAMVLFLLVLYSLACCLVTAPLSSCERPHLSGHSVLIPCREEAGGIAVGGTGAWWRGVLKRKRT